MIMKISIYFVKDYYLDSVLYLEAMNMYQYEKLIVNIERNKT
jgi:hypothetical protein